MADSLVRFNETQDTQAEGYSSIDRRQRLETGQVSYRATLNPSCSIAKGKGCGLVHLPDIQTNGNKSLQLERTNDSDKLQMSDLRKTANASKSVDVDSRNKNLENPILNYIEVEFNLRKTTPSFFIHGSDKRTPYADIDLTLKADPLPESDSNDDDDAGVNNELDAGGNNELEEHYDNDFMTLEEIQELRETNMRT
ncbi:unnamed protein product [Mytilus coruscus]|uniref:Uncharacterized protein n=1 Tax=Mytilus coruscus TaxID=42192 RepID=A0A6J8AUA0_MYTCO|nr:unnamed protein product [Mytilus coruscus]